MTIRLPEDLQRYVHEQVLAGYFRKEDDVIVDALERHRRAQQLPAAKLNRHEEPGNQELQQRLLKAGIISEIKPPITDLTPYQHRQAVPVQGEPLGNRHPRASLTVAAYFLDTSNVLVIHVNPLESLKWACYAKLPLLEQLIRQLATSTPRDVLAARDSLKQLPGISQLYA